MLTRDQLRTEQMRWEKERQNEKEQLDVIEEQIREKRHLIILEKQKQNRIKDQMAISTKEIYKVF